MGIGLATASVWAEAAPAAQAAAAPLTLSESLTVKQEGGRNPTVAVCPRSGAVYLAWAQDPGTVPQGKDGKKADPRLEVRRSDDGGRSFAPPVVASSPGDRVESSTVNPPQVAVGSKGPIALLSDDWIPYGDVKLALDTRDNAWVAFEDRRGEEDLIQVARIAPGGRATLAQAWPGTSPDLVLRGDTVILVWSGAQGAIALLRASAP